MSLVLRDVHFSYGGRDAVCGVSCAFEPARVTGLIGPNGSGKTTLLKLAAGELRPRAGAVLLDGAAVRDMPAKRRARRIAVVPQRASLEFDFSVLDMVLMGRQPHLGRMQPEGEGDLMLARAALARMGIGELEDRNARELSGGEWQRVLIARALCQDTGALLLDEPVSSLDIRHQMEVLAGIRSLSREKRTTVAVVLHDLNLAAHYCDALVMMRGGELVAEGTPGEVLTGDRLGAVYGIDARVERDGDAVRVRVVYL